MPRISDVVLVVACMFSGSSGVYINESMTDDKVRYYCNLDQLLLNPLSSYTAISLHECPLPNTTYLAALMALDLNTTGVQQLQLVGIRDESESLRADHFKNLSSLRSLVISYPDVKIGGPKAPQPLPGFLEPLTGLTELRVVNMDLPPLPAATALGNVTLVRGTSTGEWGGCQMMQRLVIIQWHLDKVLEGWLSHCPTLSHLELININRLTGAALQRVTSGLRALRELVVHDCRLYELREDLGLLADSQHLQHLDLENNHLTEVWISPFPELVELSLKYNEILNLEVIKKLLSQQKELRILRLSSNHGLNFCPIYGFHLSHAKLEELELRYTSLSKLCFGKFESMQHLDLNSCKIKKIDFKGIPMSRAPTLHVYLDWNPVEEVLFDETDYETIRKGIFSYSGTEFKISEIRVVGAVHLECDCRFSWLARALRDLPRLNMTQIECANGPPLAETEMELLECEKTTCAGNCTCRTAWRDHAIDLECRDSNLETIPYMPGLRSLMTPNNRIKFINGNILADKLIRLDVSNNLLSRLEPAVAGALFNVSKRRVRIAGNPFVCDCQNSQFIQALQEHKAQVEDYEKVTCEGDGIPIRDVVTSDLCKEPPGEALTVALVLCGVLVAFLALAAAAYCRYEREVKVFLYAHGCWLSCIHEEELDADRRFDAFISFSHGDEAYIFDRLMPGLENEPNSYNVCVHYRDWVPGEFIPAQITHSVEQSRRTIIVLSSNYLASPWGLLEFRTAHEDTLKGGRPRIIVILLEDVVGDERLSSELRGYLRSNTYVKHDDPWFWRKLRYALPHRRAAGHSRQGTGGDVIRTAARRHRPVVRMEALREA